MKVLIDLNVVLDVILQRQPWLNPSQAIWDANCGGRIYGYLVATSLTNLFYIARRVIGSDQARLAVGTCLQSFSILGVDESVLQRADALPGVDFEDNVQLAAAESSQMDVIVTRDPQGFAGAPMPVLAPDEFLVQLGKGDS